MFEQPTNTSIEKATVANQQIIIAKRKRVNAVSN